VLVGFIVRVGQRQSAMARSRSFAPRKGDYPGFREAAASSARSGERILMGPVAGHENRSNDRFFGQLQ
jgi:hypothetical protein